MFFAQQNQRNRDELGVSQRQRNTDDRDRHRRDTEQVPDRQP